VKNLNETEELFDGIFRETLENSSAPVPPGVWEGVSASIGSGSVVAGAAVKTAIWMKAVIAAVTISAVSLVAYQISKDEPAETPKTTEQISTETPTPVATNTESTKSNKVIYLQEGTPRSKNSTPKQHSEPGADKASGAEVPYAGPNPIYSMDANLVNPKIDHVAEPETVTENESVEQPENQQKPEAKELNPTTEYTYFKDSSSIFIPTAVTPDGDGINDTYIINLVGEESVEIIIYSKSNEVLFRTTNKYQAWNCKLPNGQDAPEGSYLVKVIYQFKGKSKETTVRKLTIIK
jgi:gliding motility-associated-like protein